MKITKLFKGFTDSEKAGGLMLVFAAIISLFFANLPENIHYINFWQFEIGGQSLTYWINNGLMTVFFLLIGLELKREIHIGELSNIKNAWLPVFAAIGGMLVPPAIFLLLNDQAGTAAGAGIPMATDIAFAIGILSLLGKRVPPSLIVFLTALAVIDDLGAIVAIAFFYTKTIIWVNLIISLGIFALLLVLNQLKVSNLVPYILGGIAMWYFMLHSGVHATISGILLALAIPFGNGNEKSVAYILQKFLHKPVSFLILPLFAMSNTCIKIEVDLQNGLVQPYSLGIIAGLIIGKPIGIFMFSCFAVWLRLCALPADLKWINIAGVGFLGGIGFTMSFFITLLCYDNPAIINNCKIAILMASAIAGILGFMMLQWSLKRE
jgi:NhaA family Na+:H+ antiporter